MSEGVSQLKHEVMQLRLLARVMWGTWLTWLR